MLSMFFGIIIITFNLQFIMLDSIQIEWGAR